MKKPPPNAGKTVVLLRLTPSDIAHLDELAEQLPFSSRTGLAYAAMLLGLREIDRDKAVLLSLGNTRKRRAAGGQDEND